jgi:iron complex transport system substrate-binding protein
MRYRFPTGVWLSALLLLAAALAAGGCGAEPPAVRDTAAETAAAPRVVSLAPNLTEMICALGAVDLLVGRTSACDYPADVLRDIPVVGGFGEPSLERLVHVRPTLVLEVDLADKGVGRKIRNLGIVHRQIPCRTLADIPTALRTLGELLGREAAAAAQATAFEAQLARFRATLPPLEERPSVYAEIWGDPAMTAGARSLVGEVVTLAGGRNLGDVFGREYVQVSSEWVIQADPEVILCLYHLGGGDPAASVARRAGWGTTRAVRNGRVHAGFDVDRILRPGPRVLESVSVLRACILGSAAGAAAPEGGAAARPAREAERGGEATEGRAADAQ